MTFCLDPEPGCTSGVCCAAVTERAAVSSPVLGTELVLSARAARAPNC